MREKGISQLPVTSGGVLVGMVTEADLMNFLGSGEGTASALVSKCMTRHVASVSGADADLGARGAAEQDARRGRRRRPPCPVNILSRIDLLHFLARQRA